MTNTLKTTVLLAGLGGLMLAIGGLFGQGGLVIGFVLGHRDRRRLLLVQRHAGLMGARAAPVTEAEMPEYYRSSATSPSGPACPCPAST